MGPTWSLSVFLLGYAFGMPINFHNRTSQNETLVQLNYTLDNSTEFFGTNDTGISPFQMILPTLHLGTKREKSPEVLEALDSLQPRNNLEYNITMGILQQSWNETETEANLTMQYFSTPMRQPIHRLQGARSDGCHLSICVLINLGHDLQSGGDEIAGRATSDPHGIGKR